MNDDDISRLRAGLAAQNVVPFGKYRGQPVEVMRADQAYFDWAYAQEGIRRQHPWIFNVQLGEPSFTPEHNRYQVLFLEPDFANGVWDVLYPESRAGMVLVNRLDTKFGDHRDPCGGQAGLVRHLRDNLGFLERTGRSETVLADARQDLATAEAVLVERREAVSAEQLRPIEPGEVEDVIVEFEAKESFDTRSAGSADVQLSFYGKVYRIEIKPQMGDDYPAVLRQMKASGCDVLYLVNYNGSGATLDQVVRLFKASGITVLEHVD